MSKNNTKSANVLFLVASAKCSSPFNTERYILDQQYHKHPTIGCNCPMHNYYVK